MNTLQPYYNYVVSYQYDFNRGFGGFDLVLDGHYQGFFCYLTRVEEDIPKIFGIRTLKKHLLT